ncbi:phenoloxidase 1-like [Adelges cooleyi]|uniref:phenoloxidase 1-like n=1 Tax=Adelges cooleyi TaxID=133065 RepID=UPI0021805C43|nr:phenoloxidase 1-like [Adelges cooleyi]
MTDKTNILYLFDRPTEPLFIGKGDDNVTFDIPTEYLVDRYKPLASELQTRFPSGGKTVPITKLNKIPDLSFPLSLGRNEPFSLFNPYHSDMAARLIEIFMAAKNYDEFLSLSVYCRDRINSYMFIYALSVAMIHRPDTRNLPPPSHAEMFPSLYLDSSVFSRAREESVVIQAGSRTPIEIPYDYSATDVDIEHRISYFREDVGVNLHHWHWHLVYPFNGPLSVVNKDRRGELFYYMHQQIIARYNMERLSNDMSRVVRLTSWHEPIPEGYFPKLDNVLANRVWPPRPANTKLSNINREVERIKFDIEDMERWRDRIYTAIHSGFIINTAGQQVRLTETDGIDILGNLMESSILSQNPNLYGGLHNNGHNAIAYSHDPDSRYLENYSVMGDSATAMRDPIFYRWHAYIDDIFHEFKATIPSYSVQTLSFENVRVESVRITSQSNGQQLTNELSTYWQQSELDLSRGLDFMPRGATLVRVTHLQHAPFTYRIVVANNDTQRMGTVRIFMAPKFDERGLPFLFSEQRKLFVELDRFSTTLKRGTNEITRRSTESSVTIPHEVTYRNLDSNRPTSNDSVSGQAFNFCGCGWPQNMLIAKGSPEGFQCQLFVMVSNGAEDTVQNNGQTQQTCDDASSYCGLRDARYPDARSMGFPFDRTPRDGVALLQQFLTPNMVTQDVRIRFSNRVVASLPAGSTSGGSSTTQSQNQNQNQNQNQSQKPNQNQRPNQNQSQNQNQRPNQNQSQSQNQRPNQNQRPTQNQGSSGSGGNRWN